jgi:DNA-binding MarR family transcriptional regulator
MTIAKLAATPCYCSSLRQASRYLTSFYDQMLSGSGLRVTQFSILARLRRLGPSSVNQLARTMVMDRTTLARNLQPLVRDQLVEIKPGEQDRRERVIALTERGLELVNGAMPAWERAQQLFAEHFGPEKAELLRTTMSEVVATNLHELIAAPPSEAD